MDPEEAESIIDAFQCAVLRLRDELDGGTSESAYRDAEYNVVRARERLGNAFLVFGGSSDQDRIAAFESAVRVFADETNGGLSERAEQKARDSMESARRSVLEILVRHRMTPSNRCR